MGFSLFFCEMGKSYSSNWEERSWEGGAYSRSGGEAWHWRSDFSFPSFSRRSNGGFVKFSPGSVMDFDSLKCNPGLFLFSLLCVFLHRSPGMLGGGEYGG